VILTDIHMAEGDGHMAEGDGFELISALQDFGEDIPVVAMSGGTCKLDLRDRLEAAKRLGAASTIAKPFRPALLVETIDRAIAGRDPVALEM
jgi:CheY-like chemotaxis protein